MDVSIQLKLNVKDWSKNIWLNPSSLPIYRSYSSCCFWTHMHLFMQVESSELHCDYGYSMDRHACYKVQLSWCMSLEQIDRFRSLYLCFNEVVSSAVLALFRTVAFALHHLTCNEIDTCMLDLLHHIIVMIQWAVMQQDLSRATRLPAVRLWCRMRKLQAV